MDKQKQTIEHPRSIQEQVKEHLKETGGALSSADVATFQRGGQPNDPEVNTGAVHETTVIDEPASDGIDPMIKLADVGETPSDALGQATATTLQEMMARRRTIEITPEDKEAFISAVINNRRMRLDIPIMGGQAHVAVRSRKMPETQAVMLWEQKEIENGVMKTQFDYTLRLRSMLMAAQVAEFRGEKFPELEAPLLPVAQPEGAAEAPGWIKWIDYWAQQDDAVHAVVWACIQTFEDKYWRMVEDAQDTDFWAPAASTSA